MGFIATTLATVPSDRYEWYIFLLEDGWKDATHKQLDENFSVLAREIGEKNLVVRGTDPITFWNKVIAQYAPLGNVEGQLPALLVTNLSPRALRDNPNALKDAGVVLFSLGSRHMKQDCIVDLLRDIARTLRSQNPFEVLRIGNESEIKGAWGWITKYCLLQPNFIGFGLKLDEIVKKWFVAGNRGRG